ncbi:DNA-directed RNA polymerase subunit D [Natrarchaeobius halalkaliphilus]|uniref:DNA-directed RNA polymerase subunit Rpo3 n=1 Tax=Natrarchaeobius halalkaliphilus TaxID=1679091 RepID=A0A3N6LP37_9EURY|nr:DNA-directed RNA polymerase subunit D [Natrarchaeobius halalkaliphilus]RQG91188.1 DNA-directed RNA polymerase subunit D [Natrarchaeobius halalkaliphilus]
MTEAYDVEFVEPGDRKARFLVRGVTPAFANGIRRAMVADVPTMAIDTVRFVENSSVMFDEQLALRLGLVPLSTPPEGEFGDEDTVTLSIDVEGPGTAYSGDLVSSDALVQPADENVPIIELKDGQRLEAEADAVLNHGKDHAKHQGGVAVGYRHLQRVEVVGDLSEFEESESHIVRGVIEDDGELVVSDEFDHDLANRYPGKELELEDVPNAFVFHVETDGSTTVEELVTRSVDTIEARATELEEAVQL